MFLESFAERLSKLGLCLRMHLMAEFGIGVGLVDTLLLVLALVVVAVVVVVVVAVVVDHAIV